jgi:transposase
MAVDAHGMPVKIIVTSGTEADCKQALELIKDIDAQALFADKAYDTNEILEYAQTAQMEVVIPSKKNRIVQRDTDTALYKHRHLVENAFLKLKRWRGIATRYAKTTSAFSGAVTLACIFQWLKISC